MDPYERADIVSDQYYDWCLTNAYLAAQSQLSVAAWMSVMRSRRFRAW